MSDPVYLIDASVFVFRAYYAVPNTLVDGDGNAVNALHGFARFIGDVLEHVKPQYIGVAFDESLATSFRNRLYPAYKANREPAPVELKRQFALCRQACEALGVACFSSNEYEADDIIGTLSVMTRNAGRNMIVLSRDKDLSQLVRPGDYYWDYIGEKRYAYDEIAERFGVIPERMPCYLAVMGDAVDNIRGVPGIGPKTASTLFKHFSSIHHLYDNLDQVLQLKLRNAGFVAGQLRDHRDDALLARRLTEIACDVPLDATLHSLQRRKPDLQQLDDVYDAAGFGRLLRNQAERIDQAMN
ncbi:MAG TPA: 5'-3' exonuclease H3TH domain-containing protein [Steroidobacteraceae bacterium]|nr:5'-3' exonuclease H3TH domain-containing protein [Steroidobacteraceae bacterium]